MSGMHKMHKPGGRGRPGPHRKALLGKIHIAKRDLGLDDETYRAVIGRLFKGKSSSAELTDVQLGKLVDHFVAEGFRPSRKPPQRAGARPLAGSRIARKCRALWITLHQLGAIRDPSEAALAAWVQRTTGVEALQWLDAVSGAKAVESLKAKLARAEAGRP